jgi:adenine-specific DNA methylase
MTSKGHIYMIWTPLDNSFCYIGSTFNRLPKRWQGHKYDYKSNYGNFTIHKYFDKYGIDNFKLDLIKSYDCIREHQKDFKHLHTFETL